MLIAIERDWGKGGEDLKSLMDSKGLTQLINNITYPRGKSCLDHIFTNCPIVSKSGVVAELISDHYPVMAVRKKLKVKLPMTSFIGRSYRKYSATDLREELSGYSWEEYFAEKDPAAQWETIKARILAYLDRLCPLKELKYRLNHNEWMTEDLRDQMADRRAAVLDFMHSGDESKHEEAKKRRCEVNRACLSARDNHVLVKLEESKGDSRLFWRQLNNIIAPTSRVNVTTYEVEGKRLEGAEASEYCNSYFSTIGEKLYSTLQLQDQTLPDPKIRPGNTLKNLSADGVDVSALNLPTVQYDDMSKLVEDINANKSSGIDGISAKVIKTAFEVLISQLCDLFNNSMTLGIFPKFWATATVIPIPKSGSLSQVTNWRPVSLLPIPGKLMEKVVHKHLTKMAHDLGLVSSKQCGFVKGKGTGDAVFELANTLYESRDKGEVTCAVYIDFSKAFDSIHHGLLIQRLSKLGITGIMLKWIASYLENREQSTLLNNHRTTQRKVLFGVPQGSVLGPLLFILYVNGVVNTVRNTRMLLYADDIVISASHKCPEVVHKLVQSDLDSLVGWCTSSGLSINAKKTQAVWYGSGIQSAKGRALEIKINGARLETPAGYKYLGVNLDSELKLDTHMTGLGTKMAHKVFKLAKLRRQMDFSTALKVYKQTILPYCDYCSFMIEGAKKGNVKKLQTLQNRALRICTKKYDIKHRTKKIHMECDMERLEERRQMQLALLMYKRAAKLDINPLVNPRTRGDNKAKFPTRKARLQGYKKGPLARGIALWDRIKPAVQQADSQESFKRLFAATPLNPPQIED